MTDKKATDVSSSEADNSTKSVTLNEKKFSTTPQKKATKVNASSTPVSKVGIIALLVSLSVAGCSAYLYWHANQQNVLFEQQLSATNQAQNAKIARLLKDQLTTQRTALTQSLTKYQKQLQQQVKEAQQADQRIEYLEQSIRRLSQNKPSDWLIHEAEYLIRIAVRTIWLEQDTQAAISLLQDADNRLTELNDPQFLPIRQLIHDDVNALKLMPRLDTENIILTLSSLTKQIPQLTLAMAQVPESTGTKDEHAKLSESTADWRENLAITWKKLLGDFITVTRRTGNVEPLMSPQHQKNLRENLALQLQQAQWAAREQKPEIYQQSLLDINAWLGSYFDMSLAHNQAFSQAITQLTSAKVSFAYPNTLSSLDAIHAQIRNISVIDKPVQNPEMKSEVTEELKASPKNNQSAPAPQTTDTQNNEVK